jgi:hypothetical protein
MDSPDWLAYILGTVGTIGALIGLYFDWKRRGKERPILIFRPIDEFYETAAGEFPDETNLTLCFNFWVDNSGDRDTTITGITGTIMLNDQYVAIRTFAATLPNAIRIEANLSVPLVFSLQFPRVDPQSVHSLAQDGGIATEGRPQF